MMEKTPSSSSSPEEAQSLQEVGVAEAKALMATGELRAGPPFVIHPDDDTDEAHRLANEMAFAVFSRLRPEKIPILDEELPHCNDNCIHCGVADIMKTARAMPLGEIQKHIAALAPHANGRVMFAVSELTIRPDFLDIVRSCHRQGFSIVAVVTNGRRFAYRPFAEAAVSAGATHFLVSIYGHVAEVHQGMTRTPESFEQTVAGIETLLEVGGEVMTNTVITRRNAEHLPEIVEFLAERGVRRACLSFVQMIGNAARYAERLVPRMVDVVPSVMEAVRVGREHGMTMGIGGMPYCLVPGHDSCFGVDDLTYVFNGDPGDQITERSPYEMASACQTCSYNAVCLGVQEEYLRRFGEEELNPIEGPRLTRRPLSVLGQAMFPDLFPS